MWSSKSAFSQTLCIEFNFREMMVEIFETNIKDIKHCRIVVGLLTISFPNYSINFDLYDKDQILRVESLNSSQIKNNIIQERVASLGFKIWRIE